MTESASEHSGGLRGHDKQQSVVRDQDGEQRIVTDDRGRPVHNKRAKQDAGQQAQKDAALSQPQSPGEPAGGE